MSVAPLFIAGALFGPNALLERGPIVPPRWAQVTTAALSALLMAPLIGMVIGVVAAVGGAAWLAGLAVATGMCSVGLTIQAVVKQGYEVEPADFIVAGAITLVAAITASFMFGLPLKLVVGSLLLGPLNTMVGSELCDGLPFETGSATRDGARIGVATLQIALGYGWMLSTTDPRPWTELLRLVG